MADELSSRRKFVKDSIAVAIRLCRDLDLNLFIIPLVHVVRKQQVTTFGFYEETADRPIYGDISTQPRERSASDPVSNAKAR